MALDVLTGGLSISGNTASGNAVQNNYNIVRDNLINLGRSIARTLGIEHVSANMLPGETVQQLKSRLLRWLAAPDVSFNHCEARSRHVRGTGEWLLCSEAYSAWAVGELPRLWLRGGPGTGKTILCSSAIEAVGAQVQATKGDAVIYHYFSFSSEEKQTYQGLLLSLISQMVDDCSRLDTLSDFCDRNQRHPSRLEAILLKMSAEHDRIFVVLDALDECPTERDDREQVLAGLQRLLEAGSGIQILVTSRPEPDITSSLRSMAFQELDLQQIKSKTSRDIDVFISRTIDDNHRLRALPVSIREDIRETLNAKADGM